MKKVQDTLAFIEQVSAKKDGEILHLRSQLSDSRQLVKTKRTFLDIAEDDKNMLRRQITELEASVVKLETDKKHIKAQERKKVTEFFQAQFQSQLAADRARTKEDSIWLAMNAVFTAYSNLEWSKIAPFLDPQTPIAACIPTLRAQHVAKSNQGTSSSAPSGSKAPPVSKS